jgi:hypothetical protein
MAVSHVKSNVIADFTGTVTVFNSQGSTATANATDVVRPSDWNSAHNQFVTISGNTAGQSTASGTNIVFGGTNGATVSLATAAGAATLWVSGGGGAPDRFYKEIMQGERMTTCMALSATSWSNRPVFCPFWMDGTGLVPNTIRFIASIATSSNRSLGGTFNVGLYVPANSTQLTLLGSDQITYSITNTTQGSAYQGGNMMDFTALSSVTITTEGRYVLGFMVEPVSANQTWMPVSMYGADNMPALSRILSANTTGATNDTKLIFPFWGRYSTTTGVMPNAVGLADIQGGNSSQVVDLYAVLKEI